MLDRGVKSFKMKTILVFGVLISVVQCLVIQCVYNANQYWNPGGQMYSCEGTFSNTGDLRKIEEINGVHVADKTNLDVKGFHAADDKIANFIPTNLGEIFPNLVNVQFRNTQLLSLSSSDIRQFTNLVNFFAHNNKIKVLAGDVFQFTPKIQGIHLPRNLIANVGKNFLSNLNELTWADFSSNPCVNINANTPQTLVSLKQKLVESCPPGNDTETATETATESATTTWYGETSTVGTITSTDGATLSGECLLRCSLADETDELTSMVKNLHGDVLRQKEAINEINSSKTELQERIVELEKMIREISWNV